MKMYIQVHVYNSTFNEAVMVYGYVTFYLLMNKVGFNPMYLRTKSCISMLAINVYLFSQKYYKYSMVIWTCDVYMYGRLVFQKFGARKKRCLIFSKQTYV